MTGNTKIYLGAAVVAVLAIGILGGAFWSNYKIAKLESAVAKARREADRIQQTAVKAEIEAAENIQKIALLEQELGEIQKIARKQDEEYKKLTNYSARARGDVERARRTRTINATTDELCAKLEELGHGC